MSEMTGFEAAGLMAFIGIIPVIIGAIMAGIAYTEMGRDSNYRREENKRSAQIGLGLLAGGALLVLPFAARLTVLALLS